MASTHELITEIEHRVQLLTHEITLAEQALNSVSEAYSWIWLERIKADAQTVIQVIGMEGKKEAV